MMKRSAILLAEMLRPVLRFVPQKQHVVAGRARNLTIAAATFRLVALSYPPPEPQYGNHTEVQARGRSPANDRSRSSSW